MTSQMTADRLSHRLRWTDISESAILELVHLARNEDLSGWGLANKPSHQGDVTSKLVHNPAARAQAKLVAREHLIVCGMKLGELVLQAYGSGNHFIPCLEDGEAASPGNCLATIEGPAESLLQAERVLLNFLQRLCGVATLTHTYVDALQGSPTRLLDTRKTTPGFRALEKFAVACGGGYNHRMGLFDRVMLKDNHLAAANSRQGESLRQLVEKARRDYPDLVIEVEVDTIGQIPPVLEAGADVLLLDNFSFDELQRAVEMIGNQAATEASGGITLEDLPSMGRLRLDFISTGATVHQATWMDIGLDWE